ncbi:hypothetical protein SISNIDRAFT_490051 [Sistotremastrum niveocremeum HHB9708]|uniref:Uncharacterized protein n=1 Tax=Sistotremastrum niveocremeum HHB9708 TaxID=1314777 RepID=A0A164PDV3_9AGAM|nr:hypothetical protein SISNIDRAFT_490051 [Sistotremastrum niveocremeum HHB9708]
MASHSPPTVGEPSSTTGITSPPPSPLAIEWQDITVWIAAAATGQCDYGSLIALIKRWNEVEETMPRAVALKTELFTRVRQGLEATPPSLPHPLLTTFFLDDNIDIIKTTPRPSESQAVDDVIAVAGAQLTSETGTTELFTKTITRLLDLTEKLSSAESAIIFSRVVKALVEITLLLDDEGDGKDKVAAVEKTLTRVCRATRRTLAPNNFSIHFLESTTLLILSLISRRRGPLPTTSLQWFFKEILTSLKLCVSRGSHSLDIHLIMTRVVRPLLEANWDRSCPEHQKFLADVASTYLSALEEHLKPVVAQLLHKELSVVDLGCGCTECNEDMAVILFGERTDSDDSKEREALVAILAGRSTLITLVDKLSPTSRIEIADYLLQCDIIAIEGQLHQEHQERSSDELQRLAQIPLPAKSASASNDVPILSTSATQPPTTSDVGVQTNAVSPPRPEPRKRRLYEDDPPNEDIQTKRQRTEASRLCTYKEAPVYPPSDSTSSQLDALVINANLPSRTASGTPYPPPMLDEDEEEDEEEGQIKEDVGRDGPSRENGVQAYVSGAGSRPLQEGVEGDEGVCHPAGPTALHRRMANHLTTPDLDPPPTANKYNPAPPPPPLKTIKPPSKGFRPSGIPSSSGSAIPKFGNAATGRAGIAPAATKPQSATTTKQSLGPDDAESSTAGGGVGVGPVSKRGVATFNRGRPLVQPGATTAGGSPTEGPPGAPPARGGLAARGNTRRTTGGTASGTLRRTTRVVGRGAARGG